MLIETTFKNMCRKQPPQITIKETPVSDLRWLLIKSDLLVFLPIRITKTISIGETILIKTVGNKMHKAFPLLGESSHLQSKFPLPVEGVPTAKRMEIPLPGVCTAMMKKLPVKDR
nr:hypothetical protein [Tanacetum cinerariifolium]